MVNWRWWAFIYLHSAISETYLVQWHYIDPWSIGGGRYICPGYMCILLYMKIIWCTGITSIYGNSKREALIYVHSAIFETYIMLWYSIDLWSIGGGYICPGYMCILLHVKCIWCSGIPQIYGQLEEGALVYLHSSISETYLVQWYYIDLWSIGAGGPWYMCILLYLKLTSCCGIPQIYGQFEEGALLYLHSAISDTYLVQHYSIDTCSIGGGRYICPGYMCILLYVKLIWCSGIPQIHGQLEGVHLAQVYVHSSICETYLVQWYSIDLWSIGGGIHLPWVYVHSSTCEIYLVQ